MTSLILTASVLVLVQCRTSVSPTTVIPEKLLSHMPTETERTPTDRISAGSDDVAEKMPLYLAGLFSLDGNLDASSVAVASDLALKHINEDPNILTNHELRMTTANSMCTDGVAIHNFFDQIFQPPTKIAVLGPSCSSSAQAIASTAHFWNLNVMSPTASSPGLSNRKKYPSFFRVIPSETSLNPPLVSLMKYFNWKRVATIHQKFELFALNVDDLLTRLRISNISVITSESFDEDPTNQVLNIKKQDAKIIIASMYDWDMRRVFCEAFKQGMYGEGYVWFIPGWNHVDWYKQGVDEYGCSIEELTRVVESSMYIGTQERQLGNEDEETIAGITPREYLTLFDEHIRQEKFFGSTFIPQTSYGYDAVWALALALNRTAEVLKTRPDGNGVIRGLENFTYSDEETAEIIFESMKAVSFTGVSGPVSFSGSDRIGIIKIEQLQGQCPDSWVLHERFCYLFVNSEVTRYEAIRYCQAAGGSLVSILSEAENVDLTTLVTQHHSDPISWWISLNVSQSGELAWSTDSTADNLWTPWNDEVVDVGPCFVLDPSRSSWLSVQCDDTYSYICKTQSEFKEVEIAEHDATTDEIRWYSNITWPRGVVPLDHTPEIMYTTVAMYEGVPFSVYIVSCTMALFGILLATVCLIFNVYFRKQRFIRMSSPNLNSLIIIGCILIFASTCLISWDTPSIDELLFRRFCQIRIWMFSVGFVLSFGSMFSKTWRVHKIAALKNPKRVIITDRHLFLMVAVLLLIDIIILGTWFIISPMTVMRKDLYPEVDEANLLILQPYIQYCSSDYGFFWHIALYSYKGLLLVFGVFLAWETRKVTIPALNDSKLIGLCVYNVVLLSAIGVGVSTALNSDPSVSFIFTSIIQIFCTTVTLVILFIPKMISVRKYPEGKPITTMKIDSQTTKQSVRGTMDEIEELKAQLKQLREHGGECIHTGCGIWLGSVMCGCGGRVENPTPVGLESNTQISDISFVELQITYPTEEEFVTSQRSG